MSGLVKLSSYTKVFKGNCFAVALKHRSVEDPHVVFCVLSEDDGNWFVYATATGGSSSFWMTDLAKVLCEANEWCAANCDKELDRFGKQWGWKFRSLFPS
jgi:hypothetical protein